MSAFIRSDGAETPPEPLTPTLTADGDLATAATAAAAPTQAFLFRQNGGNLFVWEDAANRGEARHRHRSTGSRVGSRSHFWCSPRPQRRSRQEAHRL